MEPQEFTRGEIDYERGVPLASNPYAWGTEEQAAWARGWRHGEEAKRKKFSPQDRDMNTDDDIPF